MRVLVCGGRYFKDKELLYRTLDQFHKQHLIDVIIEGDAPGADRMAGYWAKKNRVDLKLFPAQWSIYGNAASPTRNQQMLDQGKPDIVIAFKGNNGTRNMINKADRAGVPVEKINWPWD